MVCLHFSFGAFTHVHSEQVGTNKHVSKFWNYIEADAKTYERHSCINKQVEYCFIHLHFAKMCKLAQQKSTLTTILHLTRFQYGCDAIWRDFADQPCVHYFDWTIFWRPNNWLVNEREPLSFRAILLKAGKPLISPFRRFRSKCKHVNINTNHVWPW